MLSTRRRTALAACLIAFGGASAARAQSPARVHLSTASFLSPSTATYAQAAGTIGQVFTSRLNVFDPSVPGEDWWLFGLANRIHVLTRDPVVRRELLLQPGSRWDPLAAIESERNLRASGFIRKAEIRPLPRAEAPTRGEAAPTRGSEGTLDLSVLTQDSWTLQPQLSFGTEGGDKYFSLGIKEDNLLGYGKTIGLFHGQNGPLKRDELRYRDPRLGGSRQRLTALYARTDKGDEIGALVERPFFSLKSPYAMNLLWSRVIQQDILYDDAQERSKFLQHYHSVQASVGKKVSGDEGLVQRASLGTHYERDRFEATSDTAGGTLPADRELSGPIAAYGLVWPRYIKETYIDKMERVEDFNVGNELSISGGPMLKAWAGDRDRWVLAAQDQQGYHLSEGRFFLGQAGVTGRLSGGRLENALAYGSLNAFWKTVWPLPQTWVVHGEANAGRSLDGERQLILGGNTGLRGYKNNGFTGHKSILFNLEDRVFFTEELLHLVYLGGVAFFETGAVASEGGGFRGARFKSDVGIGFRLAPSRSTSGAVLRVDLAYALQRGPGPSRWVVSIRGGQAFQIFNSTNREALRSPAAQLGDVSPGARLRRD